MLGNIFDVRINTRVPFNQSLEIDVNQVQPIKNKLESLGLKCVIYPHDNNNLMTIGTTPSSVVRKILADHGVITPLIDEYIYKIENIKSQRHQYISHLYPEGSLIDNDRRFRNGNILVDHSTKGSFEEEIAFRETCSLGCNTNKVSIDMMINAIYNLNRFPLLVIIDESMATTQLERFSDSIGKFVSNEKQCVLSRTSNSSYQYKFNLLVKSRKLNNWLDKSTQVVYIIDNALPKAILRSEWKPMTAISNPSPLHNSNVRKFVEHNCDLILYRKNNRNFTPSLVSKV